jgi:hypothetical protein
MRLVLDHVTDEWAAVIDLAADISGDPEWRVEHSAEESCRRACKSLADAGRLELGYASMYNGKVRSGSEPPQFGRQRARLVVRKRQDQP